MADVTTIAADPRPVIMPCSLYITARWGGVYHDERDWPEFASRQEPDTFTRVPVIALVYAKVPDPWQNHVTPHWAVLSNGSWALVDGHWYSDIGPHADLPEQP